VTLRLQQRSERPGEAISHLSPLTSSLATPLRLTQFRPRTLGITIGSSVSRQGPGSRRFSPTAGLRRRASGQHRKVGGHVLGRPELSARQGEEPVEIGGSVGAGG
jgi:hypothetical protein